MSKFRKWMYGGVAGIAIAALGAVGALTQPGVQTITSLVGTETISLQSPCTVSCVTTLNTIWNYGRGTDLLYTTTAAALSTATTAEQTLGSYSLAANTLNSGTKLIIRAALSGTADTNAKTFKCYFGASVITSGTLTGVTVLNGKNVTCEVVVTKTGSSTQTVWGNMMASVTPITPYVNYGTDTDTGAITIKITGIAANGVAGDITLADFSVERLGR